MTKKSNLPCEITDKESDKKMNRQNISQGKKHVYDLEERTFSRLIGTKSVRFFVKKLHRIPIYRDYIEANESLSKKDFVFRIKICRKEAKESAYFIRLIKETNPKELENEALSLYNEAIELKKIFSSIIEKSK